MKKNGNATVTSDTAASAVKGRQAAALKHQILAPFLEFAEQGQDAVKRYMIHCAIALDDKATDGQSLQTIILNHYWLANGTYDVDMAARDLLRWPPIAARIRKAQRGSHMISLKH